MICLSTVEMTAMDVHHKCYGISESAAEKISFSTEYLIILTEKQVYSWQNLEHLSWHLYHFKSQTLDLYNRLYTIYTMQFAYCVTVYHRQFCINYCDCAEKLRIHLVKSYFLSLVYVFQFLRVKLLLSSITVVIYCNSCQECGQVNLQKECVGSARLIMVCLL